MFKKNIFIAMLFCVLLPATNASAQECPWGTSGGYTEGIFCISEDGDYWYSYETDETVIINRYLGGDSHVVIPATIDNATVVRVADWADMWMRGETEGAFENHTGLTSVTIPDSVISLGNHVFSGCTGLTSVTISDSVTSIGIGAFSSSGLTSVTIPDSVTSIGNGAFNSCTGLISFSVDTNNPSYSSNDGVLYNKEQTELIKYPGGGAGELTIPDSVVTIGMNAFGSCTGLTSVAIPDSVTSIGFYAFRDCSGLTSITIGDSVATIYGYAFSGCDALTSVTIPASVSSLYHNAFNGCGNLSDVYFLGNAPGTGDYVFRDTASDFQICYTPTATGFTTPIWETYPGEGYPAEPCACSYDTDCEDDEICEYGVCKERTDNPPEITGGPVVMYRWQNLPTVQEQALVFISNADFDLRWTFSDDFASCSEDCTHTAQYQKVGESTWTDVLVAVYPEINKENEAEVTIPATQLKNATYAFRFSTTDCADLTTPSDIFYFKIEFPDQAPEFLSEPRWTGGYWPVMSSDSENPHTPQSHHVLFFAYDDDGQACLPGGILEKHWMYRPVELQQGVVVPLGEWTLEVPSWSFMYWVLIEDPTIADTTGPGLFEFKISAVDCLGQTTDSEGFFGKRYYFLVE